MHAQNLWITIRGKKVPTRSDCKLNPPCGHWRTCELCARIRQKKIADAAQALEAKQGRLCLSVARPPENTAGAIRSLRDQIVRSKLAPAGIWTIETGELFMGLHLNILAPARFSDALRRAGHHVELVQSSARAAAAYISKRAGMPEEQQYRGRLYGKWGNISEVIMTSESLETAAPRAALSEWSLMSEQDKAYAQQGWHRCKGGYVKGEPAKPERTAEEYRAIAARHLPNLLAAVGRISI